MRRAAVSRVIDYTTFNSMNVTHLLRESILLHELEQQTIKELVYADYLSVSSTTTWPASDNSGQLYQKTLQYITDLRNKLCPLLFPYLSKEALTNRYQAKFEWLKKQYKELYGKDIDSPEVQEQFKREEELVNRAIMQQRQQREYQKQQEMEFYKKLEEIYRRSKR